MKVRIMVTLQFDDDERRAVNWSADEEGLASRQQCVDWAVGEINNSRLSLADSVDEMHAVDAAEAE